MVTRKNLFEGYEQFGHAALKSAASSGIEENRKFTAHISVTCIPNYVSAVISH